MGLFCKLTVQDYGVEQYTPRLHWYIDYSDAWELFCETFYEAACREVPVDTGSLLNSIGYEFDGDGCSCWADIGYAQYVEYGTWKADAQPYFIPALEEAEDEFYSTLMDLYQEALDEEEAELEARAEEMAEEFSDSGGGIGGGEGVLGTGGLIDTIVTAVITSIVAAFVTFIMAYINPSGVINSAGFKYGEFNAGRSSSGMGVAESLVEIT